MAKHDLDEYIDEKKQVFTKVTSVKEFLEDIRRHVMDAEKEIREIKETLSDMKANGCTQGMIRQKDIDMILKKNGFWKGTAWQMAPLIIVLIGLVFGFGGTKEQLKNIDKTVTENSQEIKKVREVQLAVCAELKIDPR